MIDKDIDLFYEKVEEGKKGNNIGIPSGFPEVDKFTYGIQRRFLTTVLGDSGSGKSSYAIFTHVYKPLQYTFEHPETSINILYFSFEMSREVLYAKILSLYLLDKYHESVSYSEIFSLGSTISEEKYKLVREAKGWLSQVMKYLTVYDTPLTATGVYNVFRIWAANFGRFEEDEESGQERFIKKDVNQYLIGVLDHCKLLSDSGKGAKYEIDACAKVFVGLRNQCDATLCAVQQVNRQFKSMDRRNSDHKYLELQDAQDTADMTQASELVIGVYYPLREKRAKCEELDVSILKDNLRIIQVLKGRFGTAELLKGCIFKGAIGYFKEIKFPEEGRRYNYDEILKLDYLWEQTKDVQQQKTTKKKEDKKDDFQFDYEF